MAQLCFQLQRKLSDSFGRKKTGMRGSEGNKPNLGVSLQSISCESLPLQDLEQRNVGALIIVSAAVVEIPLTLASALVRIIITLEDPRQLSKLISCFCRVDGFFFPLSGSQIGALGNGGSPVGESHPGWGCVYPGNQTEWY